MRIGTRIGDRSLGEVAQLARRAETLGYDFLSSSETAHNPFLPLVLAAEHTERIGLRTSIALAFARSPMDVAYLAWDLQGLSRGRFVLGLGSQVRGHIVRRFSMEWKPPAPRMREYIHALRAIWQAWQKNSKLNFQGDYYRFNLMPPVFNPGPIEHPKLSVYVSAVNPNMLRLAGEVCEGIMLHPFSTRKYANEIILPKLKEGAAKSGRTIADLDISGGGFIVTGKTEKELEANKAAIKRRIAFYASTRSYAPVMNAHGWNDTADKLYQMSVKGHWDKMVGEITDEMLEAFAVVGTYDDIVVKIKARHGSYATSLDFSPQARNSEEKDRLRSIIRSLQAR